MTSSIVLPFQSTTNFRYSLLQPIDNLANESPNVLAANGLKMTEAHNSGGLHFNYRSSLLGSLRNQIL